MITVKEMKVRAGPEHLIGKSKWAVVDGEGRPISFHETNAAAWRQADKLMLEPHNAKESRHEWSAKQYLTDG